MIIKTNKQRRKFSGELSRIEISKNSLAVQNFIYVLFIDTLKTQRSGRHIGNKRTGTAMPLTIYNRIYNMATALRAGKMNQIACCDWLPKRAWWSYLAPLYPARKISPKAIIINRSFFSVSLWTSIPISSHLDRTSLVSGLANQRRAFMIERQ